MKRDHQILYKDFEKGICYHDTGHSHGPDISCDICELREYLKRQIASEPPGQQVYL
jgi:hypothetical protein